MKLLARLGFGAALVLSALAGPVSAAGAAEMMVITTKDGEIDIRLRPDLAPNHAKQIEALAKKGFYDGVVFHRVIDGFMAQTGDPTGTGMGGSDMPDLKAEFSKEPFKRGTVGMARAQDPDSANSQFFIMLDDEAMQDGKGALTGKYTVVGEVTKGMEIVDKIKKGDDSDNGTVSNPDKMISVKIAAAK